MGRAVSPCAGGTFWERCRASLSSWRWWELAFLGGLTFAVYGALVTHPTTPYDFAAAKGDGFQVFLTYFFMRRWSQGVIAGLFHDFSPLWNASVALLFLFGSALLLGEVCRRSGLRRGGRMVFLALWLSAPFFYNRSIYQHALPCEAIGFCLDAVALLFFQRLREAWSWKRAALAALCVTASTGIYQSHANLLLTAMLGVCALAPRTTWRAWAQDLLRVAGILGAGVALWALCDYGPVALCDAVGFTIPPSGGAHDAIYWFERGSTFGGNLVGLLLGLAINWGYNAFFVVGLRFVWLSLAGLGVAATLGAVRGKGVWAVTLGSFALSVFAFPVVQCASANLRTYYCLTPLIAFSGALLWRAWGGCRRARWVAVALVTLSVTSLGHETATLYYFRWKVREQDRMHMGFVAQDLWRLYGSRLEKPVAVVGGMDGYPTGWEDFRPFRFLPLLSQPFSLYSNMTSHNVPREFYMIAREHVGLVAPMPEWNHYQALLKRKDLVRNHPHYPSPGYIFEEEGVVIVNFGEDGTQWRAFRFEDYRSPNERLLHKTLRLDQAANAVLRLTAPLRRGAKAYPQSVSR